MTDKYSYIRFRWYPADLSDLEQQLEMFIFEIKKMPTSVNDVSPYHKYREYILVRSDTLTVLISPFRALLSQKEKKPFTRNDLKLREIILKEFPKVTSTFFPWGLSREPRFDVEEEESKD